MHMDEGILCLLAPVQEELELLQFLREQEAAGLPEALNNNSLHSSRDAGACELWPEQERPQ